MKRYRVYISGYTLVCADSAAEASKIALEETGYEPEEVEELHKGDDEYEDCGEIYGIEDDEEGDEYEDEDF